MNDSGVDVARIAIAVALGVLAAAFIIFMVAGVMDSQRSTECHIDAIHNMESGEDCD